MEINDFKKSGVHNILNWIIPLITCIIGLHFTIIGICQYDLSKIPGDLGDARFNMYILEHGYLYINHIDHTFWNAPFMYPFQNVIALSDNLLGSMPIYALFRFLSFDRETSFQLWFIVICILNFFVSFYTIKKLTNNSIIASIGGYLFAFSIFLFCQFNHAQVFPRFISPLVIYWIIKYFKKFQLKFILLITLGIVFQFYCAMYLGFILLIVIMPMFIIFFISNFSNALIFEFFKRSNLLKIFLIFISGLIMLLPLINHYLNIFKIIGPRNFNNVLLTVPILSSYFFSSNASLLWHFLSYHGIRDNCAWWDQELFIGALPWLAFISTLILFAKKRFMIENKKLTLITLTLITCILLTIRFGDFTLFKFVFKIPGFSAIGTVPRIMNVFLFLFSLLLSLLLNYIIKKNRNFWFSLILLFIIIDNLSIPSKAGAFNKEESQERLEPIVLQLDSVNWNGKNAFAYMPKQHNENDFKIQLDGMLASQLAHKPCINGYSSTSPKGFDEFWSEYNEHGLYYWLDLNHIDHSSILLIH